jgi:hypothetical protein
MLGRRSCLPEEMPLMALPIAARGMAIDRSRKLRSTVARADLDLRRQAPAAAA